MLLAIDVGNTETKLGIFEHGSDTLVHHWRVNTDARRTADEYGVFFTQLFATASLLSAASMRWRSQASFRGSTTRSPRSAKNFSTYIRIFSSRNASN